MVEAQREKENEQILRREKIVNLFWRRKTFTETRKWQSGNTRPEARRAKKDIFIIPFFCTENKNAENQTETAEIIQVQLALRTSSCMTISSDKSSRTHWFWVRDGDWRRREWQKQLAMWQILTSCKAAAAASATWSCGRVTTNNTEISDEFSSVSMNTCTAASLKCSLICTIMHSCNTAKSVRTT